MALPTHDTNGWTLRGTYDNPRLVELAALYESLGFQVRIGPAVHPPKAACSECISTQPERFGALYTKKK